MKASFLGVAGLLWLAQAAQASTVYKCTTSKGTTYQEAPCAVEANSKSKTGTLSAKPSAQKVMSSSGLTNKTTPMEYDRCLAFQGIMKSMFVRKGYKVLSDTRTGNMSVLKYCLEDGTAIVSCNKDTRTMVETLTHNMNACK